MILAFTVIPFLFAAVIIFFTLLRNLKKRKAFKTNLAKPFPEAWREILRKDILFYNKLSADDKTIFEKRIQLFIASKVIQAVETDIDDAIRLMVAASAVIPTFAFPGYNYPHVHTVLIYPHSFDEKYQTQDGDGNGKNILGMVSGSFGNSTVILSKPDLIQAFDGRLHKENVGIHEFVHMLDKEDGSIDGIPELLLNHAFVAPWLLEVKKEIKKIEAGNSDINPYAITNNAEFLAVVSEYFFDNPEKFKRKHPELYDMLAKIFNQG